MNIKLNPNAVNQFSKGTIIYKQGESVNSISMIIKGRVLIQNEGARIIMGSGSFLGINDLYLGKVQSTYTALDDVMVYVYPAQSIEDLEAVLSANKDYHGFMVASHNKIIYELEQIYQGIIRNSADLNQFIQDTYQLCYQIAVSRGISVEPLNQAGSLNPIDYELELIRDRINYYIEVRNVPMDVIKSFYSYGNAVTQFQIEDQVNIVNQQMEALKEISEGYLALAESLVNNENASLFGHIANLSKTVGDSNELLDIMDSMIEEINKADLFIERLLGRKLIVDRKKMEEIYHFLLTNDNKSSVDTPEKYSMQDMKRALEERKDSFRTILDYAGISGEQKESMMEAMNEFVLLKDRLLLDDQSRAIRKTLTENHYIIYEKVFLRAYRDSSLPRLMDLFLNYGYADERLLTEEQFLSLYFLHDDKTKQSLIKVYNIREWLTLIYEGKKEPSKNEFDLDYKEMLTGMKKQGKLSEKELQILGSDQEKKLEYEIQNMFRYNNRTTNGQITSFVPVLHQDIWVGDIDRLFVTAERVNEAIASVMRIDYSVFDREILYTNKEKNIKKEFIIKKIFPEIILMPNIGSNGIMWQEITGKRRDSEGRFLLPGFTQVNLNLLIIRILGRYRWELCRTIEGTAWNNITNKSLTSEYSDYLQFYRKNKELSEEKKAKIKHQIQKGRNSSRDIFVIDYEQWINFEAMGAIKLNKYVREMLATYCPFAKEIREQLKNQPLFEEAMARYYKEKQKKIRELEARFRQLQKDKIEITPELSETLSYYREM